MKKILITLATVFTYAMQTSYAQQCSAFQVQSILVDACQSSSCSGVACTYSLGAQEGQDEMFEMQVGSSPLTLSCNNTTNAVAPGGAGLFVKWPNGNNSFKGWQQPSFTSSIVAYLNSTIIKCGYLKEPSYNSGTNTLTLPANAKVFVFTSTDYCYISHSYANLQDTAYVLFQVCGNTSGHFANYNSTPATRTMTIYYPASTCTSSVSYDVSQLVNSSGNPGAGDGGTVQYDANATPTYVNIGCTAPYIPITVKITAPASACTNATPTISGIVSGPATTYTWSTSGTGTISVPSGTLSGVGTTTISPTYTPGSGETGAVTFTLTTAGKCSLAVETSTVSVYINPTPSPTITSSNGTSLCNGNSTVLSASNTGTLTTTWSWNPGGATTSTLSVNPPTGTQVYTLTATTSCGTNQATFTITTNPLPIITIVNDSVCNGAAGSLTASGADTYTWNTGVNGATVTSGNITSNTDYTVTATNTLTTCQNTQVGHIIIRTPPTITTNSAAICQGVQAVLTASGGANNSYTWTPAGPTGNDTYSVTPSNTTSIIVTGEDIHGCINTNTVIVNQLPIFTINPGGICPGASTVLTPNPQTNSTTTYSWVPLNLTTTSAAPSVTVQPSSTTHYTITGTNTNGCSYTQTDSVVVNNTINIIAPSNTLICSGVTTTLSVSGASAYTWLASAGAVTPVIAGDYSSVLVNQTGSVTYTVSGTSGSCNNSTVFTVSVAPAFTIAATVSPSASVCPNSTVTLTGSPAGTYTYTWSGGVNDGVAFTPVSTQTYTLTGTDANGCQSTFNESITIYPTTSLTVNSPSICLGSTATLTATGAVTYNWSSTTNGGNTATTTAVPTVNPQTYTVTGTDGNGCATTVATATVNTNPLPNVSASTNPSPAVICAGSNITLSGNGALTYIWTGGITNGVAFSAAGSLNYTVTGTDANGCKNTATQSVTVNPLPVITVNSPSVCAGLSTILTASNAVTYTWSTLATGTSINVSPAGTQTYSVAGTDANGCFGTAVTQVVVNQLPTISVAANPLGNAICTGASATLTASSTSTLAVTYDWDNAGTNQNPIVVNPTTQSTYTAVATDANGCSSQQQTITISINPLPTAQTITGNTFVCVGSLGVPTILSAPNAGYWTGPAPSTATVSANSATANITHGGVYTLNTVNSCGNAQTTYTVAADSVIASFSANPVTGQVPLNVTYTNTSVGNSLTYGWSFGDNSSSTNTNPSHTFASAGVFQTVMIATDNLGCKGMDTLTIVVKDVPSVVIIPNIFSPNGDNINEVFAVTAAGISNFDCKVYDRWGLLLHEWEGTDGGWDGKAKNGVNCTEGVYFYIISYVDNQNKSTVKDGFFQLVR